MWNFTTSCLGGKTNYFGISSVGNQKCTVRWQKDKGKDGVFWTGSILLILLRAPAKLNERDCGSAYYLILGLSAG